MPNEDTKRVADIFKDARLKLGLTQSQVADRAGLNSNTYAKIERAEEEPLGDSLRKLIKALDIDPTKVL